MGKEEDICLNPEGVGDQWVGQDGPGAFLEERRPWQAGRKLPRRRFPPQDTRTSRQRPAAVQLKASPWDV